MRRNVWIELATGGLICKTGRRSYLARPEGKVGMSSVRHFTNEHRAVQYAAGGPALVMS